MVGQRLQRDRERGMIGGVSAGIAAHLDYDVTLVRLVAVLFTLVGGIGIVAYLTLSGLLPEAASTPESPSAVVRDNVREIAGLATRAAQVGQRTITRDRDEGETQGEGGGEATGAASPPPEERDANPPAESSPPNTTPPDTRPPGQ